MHHVLRIFFISVTSVICFVANASVGEMDTTDDVPRHHFDAVPIDETQMLAALRALTGVDPISIESSVRLPDRTSEKNKKLVRSFLLSFYKKLGLDAQLRCYKKGFFEGCNVEATKWGRDRSRAIVVGAHFDSLSNAGADDNGSGTVAVMEAARALKPLDSELSVRFVSFDQEELGNVGAKMYVQQSSSDAVKIAAVINAEMIGYNSRNDGAFHLVDCDRADSVTLSTVAMRVAFEMDLGLIRVAACSDRSDHAPFWAQNIPAIAISENFFGGDVNPCYHKSCDTIARMNLSYYFKVTTLVVNTVYALANNDTGGN